MFSSMATKIIYYHHILKNLESRNMLVIELVIEDDGREISIAAYVRGRVSESYFFSVFYVTVCLVLCPWYL
jgi:hypothetical protein